MKKVSGIAATLITLLTLTNAQEATTFTFAHPGPIRTMDAPVTWFGSTHWLTNLLYDCLIWKEADGSGYYGQAAESWESVDDVTWRFYLRPGITFHNGEPLDASAVKWNIDRVRTREDFMVQPQWAFVEEVNVIDDMTVDVVTTEPHAYTLADLSYNGCELLPPGYVEEVGEEEFSRSPVGSGPYKLTEFTESDRYVFEAWDDYHGGRPEVDTVIYQVIPEQSSQVAALLAGQVDMVPSIPLPERPRVAAAQGVELLDGLPSRVMSFYLRVETTSGQVATTYPNYEPTTLDKNIRLAISHALDRTLLAEVQGSATPTLVRITSPFPEAFAEKYAGEDAANAWFDPELSTQLIREAGYDPDAGNRPLVHLDAPAFQFGNEKEVAEVMAAMLTDVGFDVELNILDASAFNEQVSTPGNNRDIIMAVLGGSPSLTSKFYTCDWVQSTYTVCEEDWDAVGNEILVTVDADERLALWEQWQETYVDYAQTVSVMELRDVIGINDKFSWQPRADGWFTFRDLELK